MLKFRFSFRSVSLVLYAALIFAALSGCKKDDTTSNPTSATPAANEVAMQNTAFSPGVLTVAAGTTVKWTNNDNMTHTVTSGVPGAPDGLFDSGSMANGAAFQHTFGTKGTFKYYCKVHSGMTASVVVQ